MGKGQDMQQHLRKEDVDRSHSSNMRDVIKVVEAQHRSHMVEQDSCGLQMISADAEARAMLTALAGKIRSCKKKQVAPEDDEAEIGKDPFVSPTADVGGRMPCPSNLRGGIADEGEPYSGSLSTHQRVRRKELLCQYLEPMTMRIRGAEATSEIASSILVSNQLSTRSLWGARIHSRRHGRCCRDKHVRIQSGHQE